MIEGEIFTRQIGETSGTGQPGSAVNPLNALIERPGLNLPDIDEYCKMWKGLSALTFNSPIAAEVRIPVTPELHQMIGNISNGLDFVLFEKISVTQRGSILRELAELREEGIDRFILSYEEGLFLRDAAAAVNVSYDPGTPDEVEKRTFKFADLEQKAQEQGVMLPYWYRLLKNK